MITQIGQGVTALSIDHGNVAGHSPLELLREVMSRLNYDVEDKNICQYWREKNKFRPVLPSDVFDIIAGSGTGGVLAALLSKLQMSDKEARTSFFGLSKILFAKVVDRKAHSINVEKLEQALKELTAERSIEGQEVVALVSNKRESCKGIMVANRPSNVREALPALFRTYPSRGETVQCELWKALRATTAGPNEEIVIGGQRYSGTFVANGNPTGHLVDEIETLYQGTQVDLLLSLGSGHPSTITLPPDASADVYKTLEELSMECEEMHQKTYREFARRDTSGSDAGPYHRLNVQQGMQSMNKKAFSSATCGLVATHTSQYLQGAAVHREVDHIVQILELKMIEKDKVLRAISTVGPSLSMFPSVPRAPPRVLEVSSKGRKRLLSLDGGGMIGVSEMFLLDHLLDGADKKPCEHFDLIGGSGTGGIFAILLGRFEMSIGEAIASFTDVIEGLEKQIKDNKALNPETLTALFTRNLETVLRQISRENKPMMFSKQSKQCKAFVLANALENMNAKIPRLLGTYTARRTWSRSNVAVQDAIRATTSGRSLFTDAVVGSGFEQEHFGGTGYANNNPTYHLVEEARRLWPNEPEPVVVSLGAGRVGEIELPPNARRETEKLRKALVEICANCENLHQEMSRKLDPNLYHRLNVQHGLEDKQLWSLMDAQKVMSNTLNYLQDEKVYQLVQRLDEALALKSPEPEDIEMSEPAAEVEAYLS